MDPDLDPILNDIVADVRERLAPSRIILFGSRARGDHRPDSDYDLLIVVDGDSEAQELAIRRRMRELVLAVDALVTDSQAFERRRVDVGTIEFAADNEGRVLFERTPATAPRRVREQPPVPESVVEWQQRADNDYEAMRRALREPPVTDVAVFHAHQSAEKYLKAALIVDGVQPPRAHALVELLARGRSSLRTDDTVAQACTVLDELWPKARYPRERRPSLEKAQRAAEAAAVIRAAATA